MYQSETVLYGIILAHICACSRIPVKLCSVQPFCNIYRHKSVQPNLIIAVLPDGRSHVRGPLNMCVSHVLLIRLLCICWRLVNNLPILITALPCSSTIKHSTNMMLHVRDDNKFASQWLSFPPRWHQSLHNMPLKGQGDGVVSRALVRPIQELS